MAALKSTRRVSATR